MSACRRFGLEPGKDLAIVGHDDLPISAYLYPPLTTFRQDVAAIGVAAMECLQAQLDGAATAPYRKRFTGGLVPRESA
jgi:DNA-binding LacI/PurR family transcriptional regulator